MELNPNNPVVKAAHGQWHKLCAITMYKAGLKEIHISREDVDGLNAMFPGDQAVIVIEEQGANIVVKLMPMSEGRKLAAEDARKRANDALHGN